MNVRELLLYAPIRKLAQQVVTQDHLRRFLFDQVEKQLAREINQDPLHNIRQVSNDKLDCISALLHGIDRAVARGTISKNVLGRVFDAFLVNVLLKDRSDAADPELGYTPPAFITISPTGKCNLKCQGCYAADAALRGAQLDMATFERIITEKREMWGSHFTVISGGEPFLWKDSGHDLISLAARHPQDVFMVYTNGTLIDDEMARRLAEVGNVSPAISVEGFEKETDARRGQGVHKKIVQAFENLRRHGVPFGVSATATRSNWEVITSDEFADFYFEEQGAIYGWIFQYMPIGRGQSLEMVVPPTARVEMMERMWKLVRERKVFMADFWNSGTVSMGCISAGRGGGYFYINWDGDITPCVFVPYAADNIYDLYARGDDLRAVLDSPLFQKIRSWQRDYGYQKPAQHIQNWLCPCAIRDHFEEFAKAARESQVKPINPEAEAALHDQSYYDGMVAYGSEMRRLTDPLWKDRYLDTATDVETAPEPDTAAVR